ncbi:MAG: M24 family metallopeptidase [Planctomycetaceae bacterium]|nr:M24 family metallopeptidase [Planctomycetaceae bacterium]
MTNVDRQQSETPAFDLAAVQGVLREFGIHGWLLYDFRGNNPLACRLLGIAEDEVGTRRWFYVVPAEGQPHKLVHRIEDTALDHLPGEKTIYLRWQELEAGVSTLVKGLSTVAMEYSSRAGNPYVARVDAGTVELVKEQGVDVVSSGDLIQRFEATWDDEQWRMHQEVSVHTNSAFDLAWRTIADACRDGGSIEESAVRETIMAHFAAHNMTTYHPPIVARGPNSGLPHYETGEGDDTVIRQDEFVLIDLWAKFDRPRAVYSDLTRVGYVGESVPDEYTKIFNIVAAARDAGIQTVRVAFASGQPLTGAEVDDATRTVIEATGYGEYFTHRTGHSIGQETHGNGANIDNLETRDQRRILPGTCFSIEPGIYLPEFGIRSEVDVFVDFDGNVHVTGGEVQTEVLPILAKY